MRIKNNFILEIAFFPLFMLLVLGTPAHCFAVCDQELKERDRFEKNYNIAFDTASVTCAAGSLFTIATFGLSLAPCIAAGLTAENQKRILNEKEDILKQCEERHFAEQKRLEEVSISKKNKINSINQEFDSKRVQTVAQYEILFKQMVESFILRGFDLKDEAVQEEIKLELEILKSELEQKINLLEADRTQALSGV